MNLYSLYQNCTLCPRKCSVNREKGKPGFCQMPHTLYASKAYLHKWEEPCISGETGSGTVFFTGCNLHCVFCQNHEISGTKAISDKSRKALDSGRLSEIFFELEQKKASNINLVTPTHYLPHIADAIDKAKGKGLKIPFVYNCGGYESVDSLKLLEGLIDIYLPDFKYFSSDKSRLYSYAPDYPKVTMAAIEEMYRQTGPFVIDDSSSLMKSGLIVRHLVLPGAVKEAKSILDYLYEKYGDTIYISIMNQYTPFTQFLPQSEEYELLRRKVTKREYDKVINHAIDIGIKNAFLQEGASVGESFVPIFRCDGL